MPPGGDTEGYSRIASVSLQKRSTCQRLYGIALRFSFVKAKKKNYRCAFAFSVALSGLSTGKCAIFFRTLVCEMRGDATFQLPPFTSNCSSRCVWSGVLSRIIQAFCHLRAKMCSASPSRGAFDLCPPCVQLSWCPCSAGPCARVLKT